MRVRLEVRRHKLPSVKLLWTTDGLRSGAVGRPQHATVAHLLQQVSEVVPLEVGAAGLEDYVVEVHGYECLHFCKLEQILHENDEVTIRPLEFTDVRSRRLSGRHQISADGRHLIDGVAFGRPFLRPAPPAGGADEGDEDEADLAQLLLDAPGSHDASIQRYEDLEPEDFDDVLEEPSDDDVAAELSDLAEEARVVAQRAASMPTRSSAGTTDNPRSLKRKRSEGLGIGGVGLSDLLRSEQSPSGSLQLPKRRRSYISGAPVSSNLSVRFVESELETPATIRLSRGSETDSSDADFEDEAESESEASTTSDKENRAPVKSKPRLSSRSSSSSDTSSSGSDPDSGESEPSSQSPSHPPNESASEASSADSLTSSDTTSDSGSSDVESSEQSDGSSTSESRSEEHATKNPDARINGGSGQKSQPRSETQIKPTPPGEGQSTTQRRNHRRRDLQRLKQLKAAGILHADAGLQECRDWYANVTADEAKSKLGLAFEEMKKSLLNSIASRGIDASASLTLSQPQRSSPEPSQSVSVPRNVTQKHSEGASHASVAEQSAHARVEASQEAKLNESWRDKVLLKAVECCGQPRELSTPPFPFVQRWHQQKDNRNNYRNRYSNQPSQEAYEAGLELDYGIEPTLNPPSSYIDPQLPGQESASDSSLDLPILPTDVSSLPMLEAASIKPGAIIVFKRMEMSKATNWSPIISDYKTAKITSSDDGLLVLDLAKRDHSVAEDKDFDPHSGQRVYSRFEAPDADEADTDPGRLEVEVTELIDPRLLFHAPHGAMSSQGPQGHSDLPEPATHGVENGMKSSNPPAGAIENNSAHIGQDNGEGTPISRSAPSDTPLRRSTRTRTPNKKVRDDQQELLGHPTPADSSPSAEVSTRSPISQKGAIKTEDDHDDSSSVASETISLSPKRKRSEPSATIRKSPRLTRSLRSSSRALEQHEL